MKIANTDLALHADHAMQSYRQQSETLRSWRGERPDFERRESGLASAIAQISEAARQMLSPPAPPSETIQSGEAEAIEAARDAVDNDPFLSMIRQMIQFLTGEEVKVFDMQEFSAEMRHAEVQSGAASAAVQSANSGRAGWGMEYDYHAIHEELEQTSFSASGTIRTSDGQAFSFTLDLEMTRYYREETSVSVRAGDAVRKDPLVVNFGGTAAQLAQHAGQRFRFDIDGDGRDDLLPIFASGSAYLALDRDGNGKIDSGKELFGPASGNGFTELALLDDDGNGWIDENDAAFEKLLLWTPASEGPGDLLSLADAGIGALGLAHVASPFALRGTDNRDLGLIKSSGIYLDESGKAGSLQEIDLTV